MSSEEITPGKMQKILEWGYDAAISGLPNMSTAEELAESYLSKHHSADKAIKSLIRYQNAKAGTSGFLSGLGGVITLPVAVPVNLASVLYVQMRMVAAIAHIRGFDVRDDQVKTLVFVALTGHSATNILKNTGVQFGKKLLTSTIRKKVSGETLKKINQKVGFRLVTKFGEKGIINLGKLVPIAGGVIGGAHDLVGTIIIGNVAKDTLFIEQPESPV